MKKVLNISRFSCYNSTVRDSGHSVVMVQLLRTLRWTETSCVNFSLEDDYFTSGGEELDTSTLELKTPTPFFPGLIEYNLSSEVYGYFG